VKRGDAVAIAFLSLALTGIFSDVLFLGKAFYFRDLARFHYPGKKIVREVVLAGDFPSWNPYYAGGQPLAANPQYEVFYPPQWLIFLPDFDLGYRLHILLHLYLAAFGMYALLRDGGLRAESALFGSLAFALGGLLVSAINVLPFLFAMTWIPWVALFARRWIGGGRLRDGAFAALAVAMQCLAGEPLTILLTGAMLAVYAAVRAPHLQRVMRLLPLYAAAFAVAAVQLVPALDLVRDSVRSRGFSFEEVALWSTPPLKFAELALPSLLGPVHDHDLFYWGTAQYQWRDPFYLSIYFGLLPLCLILGALHVKASGWRLVTGAAIVSALLAVGSHTPLLRLLYASRLFTSLRYPEKFIVLGIIPLTIFAAMAFERLMEGDRRLLRTATAVAAVTAGFALMLLLLAQAPGYPAWFIAFWGIAIHPLAEVMAALSTRVWAADLVRSLLILGVLAAGLKLEARKWSWLAIAALTCDLALQRRSVAESTDAALFTPPPAARAIASDSGRLFHQANWYSRAVVARQYLDLPQSYWALRNGLFPNTCAAWGVQTVLEPDIDATNLLPTPDFVDAMWRVKAAGKKDWVETFAAMSNAEMRAVYRPFEEAVRRAADHPRAIEPIGFLRLPKSPRYAFADQMATCRNAQDLVRLLSTGNWSRRVAFIDAPPFAPAPGEVTVVHERSNDIELNVRAEGQGFLLCSITRHRYWQATIDGLPAPLVTANVAYQGLHVSTGAHVVRLTYRNPLIVPCAVISIASLLSLLALAAYDLRRDRSQRGPR
jgi:hypothetical protein